MNDCGRRLIRVLCLAASLAFVLAGCSTDKPKERGLDSLLLITLDTLRADHVSCYGSKTVQTPQLDALAERGVRMEHAWSTVPLTTPAHASILTGLYPPGHGVRNNGRFRLPEQVTTLAEILQARGRRTGAFVAAFTTSRLFGLDQGFDVFDDDFGFGPGGKKRNSRPGEEVVARAGAWLKHASAVPFFAWVHLYDAHMPYTPPAEFAAKYRGDPYSGEVAFTDFLVGKLVLNLERLGVTKNTLVVVVADHGEGLRTHGEAEHGFLLYEETLAVPFLVVAPGAIEGGRVIAQPVSIVDLFPTVCGLLGVEAPQGLQGRDLFAEAEAPERVLYAETLYPHEEFGWSALYALRKGELKYIAAPVPEFYDLAEDPGERRSLLEERSDEAARLSRGLLEKAESVVRPENLSLAAGFSMGDNEEAIARLESLGYVAGGGGAPGEGESAALPAVGGRNPREAIGDVFILHRAQELLSAGDPSASARMLEKVLARDPKNPQMLLKLALSQQMAGDEDQAEEKYRLLIDAHPTFFLGYSRLANLLVKHERFDEARLLWKRLEGLMPGYVAVPLRLADVEIRGGRSADAVERLSTLLDTDPANAEAWGLLGRARESLSHDEGALAAYRKGLELRATEKTCVEGIVRTLKRLGREEEASRVVEGLLMRAPGDALLTRVQREL